MTDHPQCDAEQRIRQDIRTGAAVVAAAVFATGCVLADPGWPSTSLFVAMLVCLVAAHRPPLRKIAAWVREHPVVWAITVTLGVAAGVTTGLAIARGGAPWVLAAVTSHALAALWVLALLRAGSRGRATLFLGTPPGEAR